MPENDETPLQAVLELLDQRVEDLGREIEELEALGETRARSSPATPSRTLPGPTWLEQQWWDPLLITLWGQRTVLLGLGFALFATTRLLAAAHYRPRHAVAILDATDTVKIVTGTALQALPIFLCGLAASLYLALVLAWMVRAGWPAVVGLVAGVLVCLAFVPLVAAVGITVWCLCMAWDVHKWRLPELYVRIRNVTEKNEEMMTGLAALVPKLAVPEMQARLEKLRDLQQGSLATLRRPLWMAQRRIARMVGAVALLITVIPVMWLPTEIVTLNDDKKIVAYFLGAAEGWTTLLKADSRSVLRTTSAGIRSRELCQPVSSWWLRSVLDVAFGSELRSCPEL